MFSPLSVADVIRRVLDPHIEEAREAALEVLLHNDRGPFHGLPRTAGWGYPEPYTRDLLIASLGILAHGDERLVASLRRVLQTLAKNQTALGHIPSLVHDPGDLGASDTTPLFLIALACYRKFARKPLFLAGAARKALKWMAYQSPDQEGLVAQQPTSDWRDEHWVLGYGLYVNALYCAGLKLHGKDERAEQIARLLNRHEISGDVKPRHVREGLAVPNQPYYALWSYKIMHDDRFDLLGNSLAILTGIASRERARRLVTWIESRCAALRKKKELATELPPCLFPYIQPGDSDWRERYDRFNRPGEYHNGGVWPFICGFYVAALVAAGRPALAEKKLLALARLVKPAREAAVTFGFNEWAKAQDGRPMGQDWQTWSAAMFLYACSCVEQRRTPFLDDIRNQGPGH